MTLKDKIIFGAIVVVVTIIANLLMPLARSAVSLGSVGNLLAENYINYVRQNGGYNSNDPMTIGGLFTASGGTVLSGSNTFSGALALTSTLTVGTAGTAINRINTGTCYVQTYSATIAASTTAVVDCQGTAATGGLTTALDAALAGVTNGDFVVAIFGTTTARAAGTVGTQFGGLQIVGASASSTSGYITLLLQNDTGTTFTWPTVGAATGTVSYIVTH